MQIQDIKRIYDTKKEVIIKRIAKKEFAYIYKTCDMDVIISFYICYILQCII